MKSFNAFRPSLNPMEERSLMSATFAVLPAEPVGPEFPLHGVHESTMNSTDTVTSGRGVAEGHGKTSIKLFL